MKTAQGALWTSQLHGHRSLLLAKLPRFFWSSLLRWWIKMFYSWIRLYDFSMLFHKSRANSGVDTVISCHLLSQPPCGAAATQRAQPAAGFAAPHNRWSKRKLREAAGPFFTAQKRTKSSVHTAIWGVYQPLITRGFHVWSETAPWFTSHVKEVIFRYLTTLQMNYRSMEKHFSWQMATTYFFS